MEINKELKGTELTVLLEGRLDTTSAPQLDKFLNEELDGVESLIFDMIKLEYISSAGLRVLLSAQKKMNQVGTMTIKNANDDIKEVFDITGFSGILTIL